MVICLESTLTTTLVLFDHVSVGRAVAKLVLCDAAWSYFEAGDLTGFANSIVASVMGQGWRVLLAQASMAVPVCFYNAVAAAQAVAVLKV